VSCEGQRREAELLASGSEMGRSGVGPKCKLEQDRTGKMAKKLEGRTYDEAVNWLREHQFDVLEAPGTKTSRVFVKKYNC
jgi:hypothetical protein